MAEETKEQKKEETPKEEIKELPKTKQEKLLSRVKIDTDEPKIEEVPTVPKKQEPVVQ